MEDLKTVKLLGAAGRKFGREFRLAVKSPGEAVRALIVLFPQFKAWILEQHERGVAWRVVTDNAEGIDVEEIDMGTSSEVLVLAPVLQGAGGGVGRIILGVVLIAVAFAIIPLGIAAAGSGIATGVGLVGASLVLGGVASLLTPTPTLSGPNSSGVSSVSGTEASRSADLESNLFSRNQGTAGQGECVPLVYGQRRISSPRLVSFDLRNLPSSRSISTAGTTGLLGYVNGVTL